MTQQKQSQWLEQWSHFHDDEAFLFRDWISPNSIDDFVGKSVLEAGCGGGQHTALLADRCAKVTAVDLNSIEVAASRNKCFRNVAFLEDDISEMQLAEKFDVVISIGVVHHTDAPDKTVRNLIRHLKVGGRLILWVYSKEGNWFSEHIVETIRRAILVNASTQLLIRISQALTALLYIPVYTIYCMPFRFLPYYEYFGNFRRMSFARNVLNVFDKLNAPQVQFISKERAQSWIDPEYFTNIHISRYKGVSWRMSATLLGPLTQ